MQHRYSLIQEKPENQIFKIVFFPDRVYHARYLNATRSSRYQYYVHEVRSKNDVLIMKGQVYLDGRRLCNFLRVEYRASRLVEVTREEGRLLAGELLGWLNLAPNRSDLKAESEIKLHYCRWVQAYQAEFWETLEPPAGSRHDIQVLDQMGYREPITRVSQFGEALSELDEIRHVEVSFRENDILLPSGYKIGNPVWDNNFKRTIQMPNTDEPSAAENTFVCDSYLVDFQRGYNLRTEDVKPVRYRNAMMNDDDPKRADDNIVEMRWLLQRELGGSMVFFHEVTVPPGVTEGTHRHIGSEELYYITEGEGFAFMADGDDPAADQKFELEERSIFGLPALECRRIPVSSGSIVFTKSGGVHGIENTGTSPLKFVAFLYHSA